MLINLTIPAKTFCLCVNQVPLISHHKDDSVITAVAASSDRDNTGVSGRGLTC